MMLDALLRGAELGFGGVPGRRGADLPALSCEVFMSDLGPLAGSTLDEARSAGACGAGEPSRGRFPAATACVVLGLDVSFVPGFFCIANPFN